ncbi:hypothetical protein ACFVAD_24185 [Sutcliffiella sp. NPDC057660]|uniref:hypothetical protein n=1 Tax=Sutcliffiella sp. NPDC057660 TaxID=3346199 RepID=UPI00368A811D
MTKFFLEVIQLSEKRMNLLKLTVFPASLIYFSYFFMPAYIINISNVIPDIKVIDSLYIVLYNFLRLINLVNWVGLIFLIGISITHYIIQKKFSSNPSSFSFDDILFLRQKSITRIFHNLLESSAWFMISIAIIILFKGPTEINIEKKIVENLFLILPTALYLYVSLADWCIVRKFGQNDYENNY